VQSLPPAKPRIIQIHRPITDYLFKISPSELVHCPPRIGNNNARLVHYNDAVTRSNPGRQHVPQTLL
jgi:hypothetical protein